MKTNLMRIAFAFCLIFLTSTLNGQEISIKSSLDTNLIKIGEQTRLSVDVQYPKSSKVVFPIAQDTLVKEVEIVDVYLDTIRSKPEIEHYIANYTITAFDSGYFVIPPQIIINQESGDTLSSQALLFAVQTLQVDTAQNKIFDIKGPVEVPWTLLEFLKENYLLILLGLLLIALIIALIWYFKKRKQIEKPTQKKIVPKEAAHVIALRHLEALKDKKLWQSDRVKLYYIELSDIVRNYIEHRYNITALEQTTFEILEAIKETQFMEDGDILKLKQILTTADMAKFAKAKPLANENDLSMKHAFELVQHTQLVENKSETLKEEGHHA